MIKGRQKGEKDRRLWKTSAVANKEKISQPWKLMKVLLGESHMSLSGPGLYCPYRLKFSSLFYPDFFDKRNLFEKPYQALELFEERQEAALVHMPTSSLGCLQLSCVVSIWALLQWQPCLCLYRYPIDLDPDHHLQTWFCRFALGPVSSQGTCLAICTLGWPWALSPGLPYTLAPILRGAPPAF